GPDGLGEVLADLVGVDVERCGELDVTDVVAAQVDVHQTRDVLLGGGIAVVLDPLDEGRRAVADADDAHPDLLGLIAGGAVGDLCAQEVPPGSDQGVAAGFASAALRRHERLRRVSPRECYGFAGDSVTRRPTGRALVGRAGYVGASSPS